MRGILKSLAIVLIIFSLAGCQALTGETAGQYIDDTTITASVKSRLVADKASNLLRVDVDTNRGVVYLTGIVDSFAQKARAEELARRVNGVTDVVNNLQIAQR